MSHRDEATILYLNELTEADCELCPEMCLDRIVYAVTEIERLSIENAALQSSLKLITGFVPVDIKKFIDMLEAYGVEVHNDKG